MKKKSKVKPTKKGPESEVLVYRVQHKTANFGPYHFKNRLTPGQIDSVRYALSYFSEARPEPEDDGIINYGQGHLFGFSSLEQLDKWFGSLSRMWLYRAGYQVAVYKCQASACEFGKTQVAFLGEGAILVETFSVIYDYDT